MAKPQNKSGTEIGREFTEKLKVYLLSVEELPSVNGEVNKTAIARAAGIPRQSLYKNPACEELLAAFVGKKTLVEAKQDNIRLKLERRVASLEQTNAALVAEVYELRRKLRKFQHIESVIEDGRRVIP